MIKTTIKILKLIEREFMALRGSSSGSEWESRTRNPEHGSGHPLFSGHLTLGQFD